MGDWQKQKGEAPTEELDALSLKEALAGFWRDRNLASFCGLVLRHLNPRISAYLRKRFRLDNEDCEDCTASAIEALIARPDHWEIVRDPQSYLYTSAIHAALDILQERKHLSALAPKLNEADEYQRHSLKGIWLEAEVNDDIEETDISFPRYLPPSRLEEPSGHALEKPVSISEEWASMVVGELFEEYEPASWVTEVVSAAVAELPTSLRVVVEHLAQQPLDLRTGDFDYKSKDALSDLGISAGTFRTRKTRAYAKLKTLIPKAIVALGIHPPSRVLPDIFSDQSLTLDDDTDSS